MTYNKSEIMKEAHRLYNVHSKVKLYAITWSEALRRAWFNAKSDMSTEVSRLSGDAVYRAFKAKYPAGTMRQTAKNHKTSFVTVTFEKGGKEYTYNNWHGDIANRLGLDIAA
jgi:hypothetical protein